MRASVVSSISDVVVARWVVVVGASVVVARGVVVGAWVVVARVVVVGASVVVVARVVVGASVPPAVQRQVAQPLESRNSSRIDPGLHLHQMQRLSTPFPVG